MVWSCVLTVFCRFHDFLSVVNITPENGTPCTTRRLRAPVLMPGALFTAHVYKETVFARITQTFEKIEHLSHHHVFARMNITCFQIVTVVTSGLPSNLVILSEPIQTGPWG